MGLPRRVPRVENTELPRGLPERQRALAVIVQAALRRAGYDVHFLGGTERPGLGIGTQGSANVCVSKDPDPPGLTWQVAQVCARRLNGELQKATPSAQGLATARRGRTAVGGIPFIEVLVRCPNDSTLRALHKALVN